MAVPVYEDHTYYGVRTSTATPSYPATVNENDILLVDFAIDGTATLDTIPSGWVQLYADVNGIGVELYWKRADGTETGTENWVLSALIPCHVSMYRFSGCIETGNPYENIVSSGIVNNGGQSLTNGLSLGDDRLSVMMYSQGDNNALTDVSTQYVEQEVDTSTVLGDFTKAMQTESIPDNTHVDGTVQYTHASEPNSWIGLFLIPVPAGGNSLINGTSNITFSESNTLTGKGEVSGASPLSFSESNILTGKGQLSGLTDLSFIPGSELTGKGSIVTPSQITFSQDASLLGKGLIIGSTDLQFDANVIFLLPGGLFTASTNLSFTNDSILKGKGILVGSTDLIFDTSVLFNISAGLFTGSSTLNFSNTGAIKGKGNIVILTTLDFVTSVDFVGAVTGLIKIMYNLELSKTLETDVLELSKTIESQIIELSKTIQNQNL